jgi:hypothetical protein
VLLLVLDLDLVLGLPVGADVPARGSKTSGARADSPGLGATLGSKPGI